MDFVFNEDGYYDGEDPAELLRQMYADCPDEMTNEQEQSE